MPATQPLHQFGTLCPTRRDRWCPAGTVRYVDADRVACRNRRRRCIPVGHPALDVDPGSHRIFAAGRAERWCLRRNPWLTLPYRRWPCSRCRDWCSGIVGADSISAPCEDIAPVLKRIGVIVRVSLARRSSTTLVRPAVPLWSSGMLFPLISGVVTPVGRVGLDFAAVGAGSGRSVPRRREQCVRLTPLGGRADRLQRGRRRRRGSGNDGR